MKEYYPQNKDYTIIELLLAIKDFKEKKLKKSKTKPKLKKTKKLLIEEYDLMLSGTQYLDKNLNSRYYNAEGSRAGTIFELYHEDDNLYDPLAIMVLHKGKEIGYIPRDENLEIAYYLYHPEQFIVECRQKKKQIRRDFEMIVVIVKIFAIVEDYIPFSFEVFDEVFADYDERMEELKEKRKDERLIIEQRKAELRINNNDETGCSSGCLMITIFIVFILLMYILIF